MRPNPHKYHYLPERERIKCDPRLEGFWALGVDTVSEVQEGMASIWRNDTTLPLREKQGVDMPLYWLLTRKLAIDYDMWNTHPHLWRVVSKLITDEEGNTLANLTDATDFLHLLCEDKCSMEKYLGSYRYYQHWDILIGDDGRSRQLRASLIHDMRQYGAAHPMRNVLLFQILARRMEPLMGMGYQGSWQGPVPVQYANGWRRDAIALESHKQQALIREVARFLDYALPVLCERFGQDRAIQILKKNGQGLLNFWLTRNTPEVARSVGSEFQKYYDDVRLARVNARQPIKRLPKIMIEIFATEYCPVADVSHVCLGRSLRDLPSVQPGEGQPRKRLSARAAHVFGQMEGYYDTNCYKDIYRAICLSIWPNDSIAGSIAQFYEYREIGDYFDPFLKEMVLFFKRNETEMEPGLRTDHLIDYLYHEKQARPDFSLKGRTIASMVRRMEAWHEELWQLKTIENKAKSWLPSTFSGFEGKTTFVQGEFEFVQILDQHELIEEGRKMRHCVASYVDGCIAGNYSIWSLRKKETCKIEQLLTIQVNSQGSIVQACGPHNRLPGKHERQLLQNWAKVAALKPPI